MDSTDPPTEPFTNIDLVDEPKTPELEDESPELGELAVSVNTGDETGPNKDVANDLNRQKKRNVIIVALLLAFTAVVVGIGLGVGLAAKGGDDDVDGTNNQSTAGGDGAAATPPPVPAPAPAPAPPSDPAPEPAAEIIPPTPFTLLPTTSPTSSPTHSYDCIDLEVGIVFDEYAGETSWELAAGTNSSVNLNDTSVIVWDSPYYGSTFSEYSVVENVDGDNERKQAVCLPEGLYTFTIFDMEGDGICCDDGEGMYVLTSEGKRIAFGGDFDVGKRGGESSTFTLPFVEPEAGADEDGDGLDDATGHVIPPDTSGLVMGESCENVTIVIQTDLYGLETSWQIRQDNATGPVVVEDGPYASSRLYTHSYCLPSQRIYVLTVYDWQLDGMCCSEDSGYGYYQLHASDILVRNSTGEFGDEEVTPFTLPYDSSAVFTPVPTASPTVVIPPTRPGRKTLSPTPAQPTGNPIKEATGSPTLNPSASPTLTIEPTKSPSAKPTQSPSTSSDPTLSPSNSPTEVPTVSPTTSSPPTAAPTTAEPTKAPKKQQARQPPANSPGPTLSPSPPASPPVAGSSSGASSCQVDGGCSEPDAECTIGTETCCGVSHASVACTCNVESLDQQPQWKCANTDACLAPSCCPDPESVDCAAEADGLEDECEVLGEECGDRIISFSVEYCCQDRCGRKYCQADDGADDKRQKGKKGKRDYELVFVDYEVKKEKRTRHKKGQD